MFDETNILGNLLDIALLQTPKPQNLLLQPNKSSSFAGDARRQS